MTLEEAWIDPPALPTIGRKSSYFEECRSCGSNKSATFGEYEIFS